MKRILIVAGVVIVVLLGAALIAPAFIDWNKYKGQILAQMHNATGHDYEIGGNLSMAVLPTPHVAVDSLTVRAPKEQGGATLLTLDKADINVALLPLLSGKLNIRSVTLDKPVFSVGVDKNGTPTWMTPQLQPKQAGQEQQAAANTSSGDKIVLQSVNIKDGSFTYADARNGSTYAAQKIDLKIKADSLFGPYDLDGSLDVNGETINLQAHSGAIGKDADSVAMQVMVALGSGKGKAQFAGVTGIKAPYQVQGEVKVEAEDMAAALAPFTKGAAAFPAKPVSVAGMLTASSESVAFTNARFAYGTAELAGEMSLKGLKQESWIVNASLGASKPVNFDELIVPAGKAGKKGDAGTAGVKANGFLPATLSLPKTLTGKVAIDIKSAIYKGQTFGDVRLSTTLAPKALNGTFSADLPGNGGTSGTFGLTYAGLTKNPAGGVILSGPSLAYRVQMKTDEAARTLGAFMPPDSLKKAGPILSSAMALDVKGSATGNVLKADAGSLTLKDTPLAFSATYAPKANKGRDMITLLVSGDTIDADGFLPPKRDAPGDAAKPADNGAKGAADSLRSFSLPFDLDLGANFRMVRYQGNGYANVMAKLKLVDNALSIDNSGFQDESGNVLRIGGGVGNLKDLSGIDISVNGKTPDANLLLKTLKVDAASIPKNVGPAEVAAEFKGQADRLGFTANLRALRGTLEMSGALADLLGKPSFSDLTIRLRHPNYEDLARLFSPSFHASVDIQKNLDLFTSMQKSGNVYTFKEIKAVVGPATMNGDLRADMGSAVPSITSSLQFTSLPLDKLLGAEATVDTGRGSRTIEAASMKKSSGGHWSRTAINAGWMRKYNADIKVTAGNASYGNWQFANADMAFVLKDGTLTLTKLNGGMYGGRVALSGKLASPATGAKLDASGHAALDGVSLESFMKSFSGSNLVQARGAIDLNADVIANGESPTALISSLNGKGTTSGKDIQFQGFDLAKLSSTLAQPSGSIGRNFGNLLDATVSGGTTTFDTLDGAFTITGGVINLNKMRLTGPDAMVDMAGNVNLPLWTVEIENTITLLPIPKTNPPPPLKIAFKGPLDNPAQTFGKGPLENYFMQNYGGKLQEKLLDKLDKKGVLEKSGLGGVLGDVLGLPQKPAAVAPAAKKVAPAPAPVAAPAAALVATPEKVAPIPTAMPEAAPSEPAAAPDTPAQPAAAEPAAAIPTPAAVPETAPSAAVPAPTAPESAAAPATAATEATSTPGEASTPEGSTPPAQ